MRIFILFCSIVLLLGCQGNRVSLPTKYHVLDQMKLANSYFIKKWPDPGQPVINSNSRAGNLWSRAVYYNGLMALQEIDPSDEYYNYAVEWGNFHDWKFRGNRVYTNDANHLCAAQTYIDLFLLDPEPERIRNTKLCLDSMLNSVSEDDWSWIDALYMAMPVYARMGVIYQDDRYFDKMHALYLGTRNEVGGGLYNSKEHLWWSDADNKNSYRSRGNGWAYAALVHVLDVLPDGHEYREEYLKSFIDMSGALVKVQRPDGFWNPGLLDENNPGGRELTGTALFTYGLAWGINKGILKKESYLPPMVKAWNAMSEESLHANGILEHGHTVSIDSKPEFEDCGLGCFLLAGADVYKMIQGEQFASVPDSKLVQKLENLFYNDDFLNIPEVVYRANDYGAAGDGVTDNTEVIQKVIDLASDNGGGIIEFNPGIYMTASLFIKSNIEFRIEEGVALKAIQIDSLYPIIDTRIAGIEMKWPAALINVNNQENVRITGKGIIDGNGEFWWRKYWGEGRPNIGGMRKEYTERGLRWVVDYDCRRVRAFVLYKSRNIHVKDLTVKRSGFWSVTMTYCNRVHLDGIKVRANIGGFGPSSDGINTDSSSDILVENCDVDCNDDNYCIKAGRDSDGQRVNKPSKNVVYRNSISRKGHGMFSIGSETSGGIHNIEVYNLDAMATSRGVRLKSANGRGGVVRDVHIHDIRMDEVENPFLFDMSWNPHYNNASIPEGYDKNKLPEHWYKLIQRVDPDKAIPEFRDITLSDITVTNSVRAIYGVAFVEKKLDNFVWNNVSIQAENAGTLQNASNWKMNNVQVIAENDILKVTGCENIDIPEGLKSSVK